MSKKFVQHQTVCHWRHMRYRLMLLAFALVTVSQTTGCGVWKQAKVGESVMITYRDHVWGKRAYNLRYSRCDRPYAEHFENGFRAGYTDVSQGGDGYVPALPPVEYRSYEFQSADGAKCVSCWFEGYPAGVAAAKRDKSGNYNDVLISRMINSAVSQESVNAVLPQDVPVVSAQQEPGSGKRSMQLPAVRSSFTPVLNSTAPSVTQEGESGLPPQANTITESTQVERANYNGMPPLNEPLPMVMPNANWESQQRGK